MSKFGMLLEESTEDDVEQLDTILQEGLIALGISSTTAGHTPSPSPSSRDRVSDIELDESSCAAEQVPAECLCQPNVAAAEKAGSLLEPSDAAVSENPLEEETEKKFVLFACGSQSAASSPDSNLPNYSNDSLSTESSSSVVASNEQFPASDPWSRSGSTHLCRICGDRSSGNHYGVSSCEGCKAFFKRIVRDSVGVPSGCRGNQTCLIDKGHRNRCRYCRYKKCISKGMKPESVQVGITIHEVTGNGLEGTSSKSGQPKSTAQDENEKSREGDVIESVESRDPILTDVGKLVIVDAVTVIQETDYIWEAGDKEMFQLVEWAKQVPRFNELALPDRILILKSGWNELLLIGLAHRSLDAQPGLVFANGLTVYKTTPGLDRLEIVFDEMLRQVVKLGKLRVDGAVLCCLKQIILFDNYARGLHPACIGIVEAIRDDVQESLEKMMRSKYPKVAGHLAKLLLLLPTLRSIGLLLDCHLFYRLRGTSIDEFLRKRLLEPSHNKAVKEP